MNCYETNSTDNSVHNCHLWSKNANAPATSQCDMCAKETDRLIPCVVCEGTVCEACINSATFERFLACGAYETICNSCVPPDAGVDPDGRTALILGDRKMTYCLICQEYHEDVYEGVVDCDIDNNEFSPLTRLCIDRRAERLAEIKSKKSSPKGANPMVTPNNTLDAEITGCTAKELQRDTMLIEMQVKLQEMEKNLSLQIEKSLNLKITEIEKNLNLKNDCQAPLDKAVQTNKNDLRAAEVLFRAHKARENPTQAIIDSLPKIIDQIANTIEKKYRFKGNGGKKPHSNKKKGNKHRPNQPTGQNKNGRNSQL